LVDKKETNCEEAWDKNLIFGLILRRDIKKEVLKNKRLKQVLMIFI
jgi:hypothetical protein